MTTRITTRFTPDDMLFDSEELCRLFQSGKPEDKIRGKEIINIALQARRQLINPVEFQNEIRQSKLNYIAKYSEIPQDLTNSLSTQFYNDREATSCTYEMAHFYISRYIAIYKNKYGKLPFIRTNLPQETTNILIKLASNGFQKGPDAHKKYEEIVFRILDQYMEKQN